MELFKNNRKMFFSSILLVLQLSAQYCNISAVTGHPSTASLRRKKPSDGAKRNIRIVLLSVKCTNALPQIIEFFECQMNRRNDRVYTSGSLRLREPIARLDANVFYHLSGQLKSIFNLTLDCCALLANGRHNSKIFDSVLKILFARINVLPHCPLKANFNYTITDFDLNESLLPIYIPRTNFNAGLHFRFDGRPVGLISVEGKVLN